MIGNYNNDYDYDDNEYLNDDTIEIPLSCKDDEYREGYLREREQEQEQEQKSVLQKMIEYKNENTFLGHLYEMSGVFGFTVVLLLGFILTLPILFISGAIAFFITLKERF
ncbi:TPA: hypothetical protein ACLLGK_003559 [Enterobacter roggenkampii]